MKRTRGQDLLAWKESPQRRPLVIRGARQVGKTWLVRDFASSQKFDLVEVNFEKRPDYGKIFQSNHPKEILFQLGALLKKEIDPDRCLLFLDEIQESPRVLASLRWFAEEMPELPVIAAGSLLEFVLEEHSFSMPVGRINYLYLEPLSYEEFLLATGRIGLQRYLETYSWDQTVPEPIHEDLMAALKEYMIVGGMPAAVALWSSTKKWDLVQQVHVDLLATYQDDFAKYRGRLPIQHLRNVMQSVPRQLGKKFVYRSANPEVQTMPLKTALELLTEARICHVVLSTAANGLPLGAETNQKFLKAILLDVGLCSTSLGLSLSHLAEVREIQLINSGGISEQLVGQLLRTLPPYYVNPQLYYWQRVGADAEVDYVLQISNEIVPVEVKAGTTGKLKSLHEFMEQKGKKRAIRISSAAPKKGKIESKGFEYELLSLPFYLMGQLDRLYRILTMGC